MKEESIVENIEKASQDVSEGFDLVGELYDKFTDHLPSIIFALVFLALGVLVAKIIKHILNKMVDNTSHNKSLSSFISQVIYAVVIGLVLIVALSIAGVPTSTFAAILGGLGVAIGIGFRDSLGNLSSGVLILLQKPYDIGDYVATTDGLEGTVVKINLMSTVVETIDGKLLYMPNLQMTSETVINYSQTKYRKVWLYIDIEIGQDVDKALKIIREAYLANDLIKNKENINTVVYNIKESCVTLMANGLVDNSDYLPALYSLNEEIYKQFEEKGIKLSRRLEMPRTK